MKLATYTRDGAEQTGVVVGDRIVPTGVASMLELIGSDKALGRARTLATDAGSNDGLPLSDVTLLAPIPRPRRSGGLEPQVWLKDGDVMEADIEGIGSIANIVRAQ